MRCWSRRIDTFVATAEREREKEIDKFIKMGNMHVAFRILKIT